MIRKMQNTDINRVADIWLKTNLKAHDFIPEQYWTSNYELVKEMMSQAEVYVYEDNKMIQDVDQSTVLDSGVIDSPVLGKIPPTGLSGGVKTLILVKFDKDKIFNASTCGDNCAKWLLKIAESEDRTINLRHLMNFGKDPFVIRILNTGEIVHSMEELVSIAGEFV